MRRLLLVLVALVLATPALAQVAHDAASESHAGTTGSVSEASFMWTHTPVGTPRGVAVCVMNTLSGTDKVTSITYGSLSLSQVSGGTATSTGGDEDGETQVWFGGASVPTGAQTVTVTRTNDTDELYAVAVTVTAGTNTDAHTAGIVLLQDVGAVAEQSVTDGSPGTNSVRYACGHFGYSGVISNGANSSGMGTSIDFGVRVAQAVRETTAGQGSRSVGWTEATSDDRAAVHFAVKEAAAAATGAPRCLLVGVC